MSDEMKTAVLGPLPEPFMELHREISPHVYAAWAEQMRAYAAEQVAAERERWESAIGALMPADFKQWRDSPVERPATAAWCIANAREQADQAWAQLKSAARWMRAVDEAMVTYHAGTAEPSDTYEAAKGKLNTLLCIVQDIGAYHERERCAKLCEAQLDEPANARATNGAMTMNTDNTDPVVGHKTYHDESGARHAPLRQSEATAIMAAVDEAKRRRAEVMPTEQDAARMMWEAYQRLRELGWRSATYCPRDGRTLLFIEAGSSGIHEGHCDDEGAEHRRPTVWLHDAGDLWPSEPVLYREQPNATQSAPEGMR